MWPQMTFQREMMQQRAGDIKHSLSDYDSGWFGQIWCILEQSMEWIELKRSSPVRIHEPLILIQSNPADGPERESRPVQSGHNRVGIYQIPCKIDM